MAGHTGQPDRWRIGRGMSILAMLVICFVMPQVQSQTCSASSLTASSSANTLTSPNYPSNYVNGLNCRWEIRAQAGQVIQLTFNYFALEYEGSCGYDWVEILDGSRSLGRFCGGSGPGTVTSSSNQLTVVFRTDHSITHTGFSASYVARPSSGSGCSTTLTASSGTFTSPSYPSNYNNKLNCTFDIRAQSGQVIQLTFNAFSLESHGSCLYDWVEVLEAGTTSLGRFCGTSTPERLTSTSSRVTVWFRTDGSVTRSGFSASYVAYTPTVISGCGGSVSGQEGQIISPGYPSFYSNFLLCSWLITGLSGDSIRVSFHQLDLEFSPSCQRDSLEFRDGSSVSAPRLSQVCGSGSRSSVTSSGNVMFVRFVTDQGTTGGGFNITWASVCEESYQWSQGTILSPANTGSRRECTYVIEQQQSYVVRLQFQSLRLGNSNEDCEGNYVEVRDGGSAISPLIGRRYCGSSLPEVTSTQNRMWIRYVTDGSDASAEFRALYTREIPRCETEVRREQSGTITSPLYPNNYRNRVDCTWEIEASAGHVIQLTFDTFILEGPRGCPFDSVEIFDDSTLVGTYCGVSGPETLTSSSNRVSIRLRTDGSVTFRGFSATFDTFDPFTDERTRQLDLYPYGEMAEDEVLVRRHDKAKKLRLDTGFPVGNRLEKKLFIANKGLVSFGRRDKGRQLRLKPDKPMICPYNADIGAENTDGNVYYQLYTDDETVLNKASNEIREFTEHSQYTASLVLVVTWSRVAHINSRNTTSEQATVQLALISDGRRSYGLVFYQMRGMRWSVMRNEPLVIGFSDGQQNNPSYSVYSNTAEAFTGMDRIKGNTGRYGMWLYSIGHRNSADQKCQDWYRRNLPFKWQRLSAFWSLPRCPCNRDFIWGNWRAAYWRDNYNVLCYRMSVGRSRWFAPYGKECCYTRGWSWSWFGQYVSSGPHAGSATAFNPALWVYRHDYEREEREAHDTCCYRASSARYCSLYYELRPVGTCSWRIPFRFSWTWGDPHIKTLDGKEYTFNGWGEYTMISLTSDNLTFTLQGRTGLAETESGSITNATVFTAFGAEENGVRVFIGLDPNTNDTLIIYGNNSDYSTAFRQAGADDTFLENELYMMQRSNDSVVVTFTSEIQLTVSIGYKSLDIFTSIPLQFQNLTEGLLGNFNGVQTDDFLLPNGTTLNSNLTDRQIYQDFGPKWAVTDSSTVMRYGPREGPADFAHPEFTPIYLDEVAMETRQAAEDLCGAGNVACIYDYVATGSQAIASASKTTGDTAQEREAIASNNIPVLNFNQTLNGASGQTLTFNLEGHDPDTNDILTYYAVDDGNGAVQVNSQTGDVTLSVNSSTPVSLSFYATDSKNVSSPVRDVTLITCSGCSGHGSCDYNVTTTSNVTGFLVAACDCLPAWTGEDCELDFDACEESPCDVNQECTDLTPLQQGESEVGFTCSGCPEGFDADPSDSTRCIDIDECAGQSNCTSLCVNSPGSYTCDCEDGYRLSSDDVSCDDVNECAERTADCEQQCNNTEGGFQCVCFPGYSLSSKGSCEADNATHTACTGAGCQQGCTSSVDDKGDTVTQCFCYSGYTLDPADNSTCLDRDECADNVCSQSCENVEGSFACTCYAGHTMGSDGRTCSPCPKLRYGADCRLTCQCNGRGRDCDPVTGCVCQDGWTGSQCQDDVDECQEDPDVCGEGKLCVNNNGSFACVCPDGYNDNLGSESACIDLNECSEGSLLNTCQELEDCSNVPGSFYCTCKTGYTRVDGNCADIDECNSTQNRCEQVCNNMPGTYNCECRYGFRLNVDRTTCSQVADVCAEFEGLSCDHGCSLDDSDRAFCFCRTGFVLAADNQTCQDVDECSSDTDGCSGSSVCINTEGGYRCQCATGSILDNDGHTCLPCPAGTFGENCNTSCACGLGASHCDVITGCVCKSGWIGPRCDQDIDECVTMQESCQAQNALCVNFQGGYRCSCAPGYSNASGSCEDVDECASSPCEQGCENSVGSYRCLCNTGFSYNMTSAKCVDINECSLSVTNECTQRCDNIPGSYRCSCDITGYTLDNDGVTCIQSGAQCRRADCPTLNGGCSQEQCFCNNGYNLTDSNTCEWIDLDLCADSPCEQQCTESASGRSFLCSCRHGYRLNDDQRTCRECSEGTYGESCSNNCTCNPERVASCDRVNGTCHCKAGWEGVTCDDDIDECSTSLVTCPDHSECLNNEGSYSCPCLTGFVRNSTGLCSECPPNTYGRDCAQQCNCTENSESCDHVNGTCVCKSGWEGSRCGNDINECLMASSCLGDHVICQNEAGRFRCDCERGYERNESANCEECKLGTYGEDCSNNCTCNMANIDTCDHVNGTCSCKAGWEGVTCDDDIDECTASLVTCPDHSTCQNTEGSYHCQCLTGFFKNSSGLCAVCPPNMYGANCTQQCNCTENSESCDHVNGTCECKSGWEGARCESDIDECQTNQNDCSGDHVICVNQNGWFTCECEVGYRKNESNSCVACSQNTYGTNCTQQCNCTENSEPCDHVNGTCVCKSGWEGAQCESDIDECRTNQNNCSGDHVVCRNQDGGFYCDCEEGYRKSESGTCQICSQGRYGKDCNSACICNVQNVATCDHVNGRCSCKAGWEGVTCDDDIDECSTEPQSCGDHSRCQNTQGSFVCPCLTGYVRNPAGNCAECSPNMYGTNCTLRCDCTENSESCNHVDGTCICKSGWEGTQCESDIDECRTNQHNCSGDHVVCSNQDGGFSCDCEDGYSRSGSGSCQQCPEGSFGKDCGSSCTCNIENVLSCDHVNGTCYCKAGWEGVTCDDDIDECNTSRATCPDHSTCQNTEGSYDCQCLTGFFKNSSGFCEECEPLTYGTNCSEQCNCSTNTQSCNHVDGSCICKAGWNGSRCENDVDECATNQSTCPGDHVTCMNKDGGFLCQCDDGFRKNGSSVCEDFDECSDKGENDCKQKCTNTVGSYNCSCFPGYSGSGNDCRELTRVSMTVEMKIRAPQDIADSDSETYSDWVEKATLMLYKRLKPDVPGLAEIIIKSLRLGSLIIDYDVVIDTDSHPDAASDLSVALVVMAGGQLTIDNQTASVALTMKQTAVDTSKDPCDVFMQIASCLPEQECQMKNGAPTCQAVVKNYDTDRTVLYVGVGFAALAILSTVVVVVVVRLLRRRSAKPDFHRRDEASERASAGGNFSNVRGKLQGSWPGNHSTVASLSSQPSSRRMWRPYNVDQN